MQLNKQWMKGTCSW